jgi:hypothetical protein
MNDQGASPPDYQARINHTSWETKRAQRIELDHGHCMLCGSTEELHVHHNTYDRLWHEEMDDLITVCKVCHDVFTNHLRNERYKKREYRVEQTERITPQIAEQTGGRDGSEIAVQDKGRITPVNAQRTARRPNVFLGEGDSKDQR